MSSHAATKDKVVGPEHILQVGMGFWASKTLLSAVEIDLFTELARRPGPLEDVSGRLGLHPRSARDFLDALVALKFIQRRDGVYSKHAGNGDLPRQAQADLHRWNARDGEPSPVPVLEQPDRGASDRQAAERGQVGR